MNPVKHSRISVKRWGGVESDYLDIHAFIDHTKMLCADARHRILHTTWAVNNIVVPIFGHTLENSDGKLVDIKDMCERDHLLVDYHNKFIPTLADFVEAISDDSIPAHFSEKLDYLHQQHVESPDITGLMLSPLVCTGRLKSLLITHNSWFVNAILPKVFRARGKICDYDLTPSSLFDAMSFELWMDNGMSFPGSAKMLEQKLINRSSQWATNS